VVGSFPWSRHLLYVPVAIALLLVFGTALAILLSAVNVYLRDVQHLIEIVILILFWASPIVYSFSFVTSFLKGGWLEELYLANPVTLAILAFQRGIWVAQRVFARLEGNFAQEL
jgi:ABC-2 type transport system permease protein